MVTHTPVTEQIRRTPIPVSLQVNPSLMPSVESVTLYFQLPGETIWNSKPLSHSAGGVFTTKIDCADGMYIFDPEHVKYYIVVLGVGGTVLVNEPAGQATAPHIVKMVQMLAGQPPVLPGMGPEAKCREITCFSNKECIKELGEGSSCFEGICSPPPIGTKPGKKKKGPKGPGMPGLFMINLAMVPYGFGLVAGSAYPNTADFIGPGGAWVRAPGPEIQTGMAGSGPALRFNVGYFLKFGLGFTGFFRMQFLKGDNSGWDDKFENLAGGARVNFMAVRKKLIYLNVFLGGGYGHYRHKIEKVPNPCWISTTQTADSCSLFPDGLQMLAKPYHIDFWRASGLFDITAGTTLIIRPVDVFGITVELALDFLVPTFAMNVDASIGVAFFFGNGFKGQEKAAPAPATFQDPALMY
jgi:hypothetical protein